jgi:hypothetical protein
MTPLESSISASSQRIAELEKQVGYYVYSGGPSALGHSFGRTFNGTNQSLSSSTALSFPGCPGSCSTNQWTFAFWLDQLSVPGGSGGMIAESTTNAFSSGQTGAFFILYNSVDFPGNVEVFVNIGGGFDISFADPSTTVWHDYVISVGTGPAVSVYIDGSSVSVTIHGTPTNATLSNQTAYLMARANSTLWENARFSEFAIYKTNLSSTDASNLWNGGAGRLASSVQGSSLVSYTHLCGTASPEPDQIGAWTWGLTGTPSQVAGPGVLNCP